MALGFMSLGALVLGLAARDQATWMLAPSCVLFVTAAVIWVYGRVRAASADAADRHGRALARLAVATVALALIAAAIVIARAA
jgi:uncharacterized membrane protein YqjE